MYRKYTPSGFVGIETRVRLRTRVLIPTYPRGVYSCTFSPSGGYYQYPLLCIAGECPEQYASWQQKCKKIETFSCFYKTEK